MLSDIRLRFGAANASWSNVSGTNVFLPMILQLVYHVCGVVTETDSPGIGVPYRFRFSETAMLVAKIIRRPDDMEEMITTRSMPDPDNAACTGSFAPACCTYYTIEGGSSRRWASVVNPDTAESDLARISHGRPERHLAPTIVRFASSIDEVEKLVAPLRKGVHLRDFSSLAPSPSSCPKQ